MSWNKIDENKFTYNEGSLNFTLQGGAFHDEDGDGVPDGVSFENGRPVFMGVKNLKDFHFDVPRDYLIVNGNEYKLLDLDNNAENGEELQLFNENKGFPEGEDRTNKKAYKKSVFKTGYKVEQRQSDSSCALLPIVTPPPTFVADAKFKTEIFLSGNFLA